MFAWNELSPYVMRNEKVLFPKGYRLVHASSVPDRISIQYVRAIRKEIEEQEERRQRKREEEKFGEE